ncbi:zinc finger protein 182-like [Ambystoma mexicanum]|uniref:zinc finger protein 182-like n=1 Tax=Ambystoma mexicanum TaxID=8296 RepID=UPI0037E7BE5E
MEKSSKEVAGANNVCCPRKRGAKPCNRRVKRPALKFRLPEQQVQKMYKCSKCQRRFSHYSLFFAHQRYEMRKKTTKSLESAKLPEKRQKIILNKKNKGNVTAEEIKQASNEASTSQKVNSRGRKTEESKNKGKKSSKAPERKTEESKSKEKESSKPQRESLRLRERKTYTCNVCQKSFNSKSSVVVHKGANNEEVYNCLKCEDDEEEEDEYENDEDEEYEEDDEDEDEAIPGEIKHECDICRKRFAHRTGLLAHRRSHTGNQPHQCFVCHKTFGSKSALVLHEKTHKRGGTTEQFKRTYVPPSKAPAAGLGIPKPHQCQYCEKSFNDKALLVIHERTHSGESPHQCGKCQKTFTSQNLLAAHSRTHITEKSFQCNMCDKSFNGEALLLSHKSTHTGEKIYQCNKCKVKFLSEALLTEHEKVHVEDRPHKCDYCEKGFNSQALLLAHRRIHTGEKAFHCHYCGEGFNASTLLNVHLRNHAPEKPYPCDLCEKSFNLRSLQQAHRATHEEEK